MKMRLLGQTGIRVSPYCLGTMMFGVAGNKDQDDCVRIIHQALDSGINFIDTADVYSASESEEIVGKALKGRRADVVLATKGQPPVQNARMHWVPKHMTDEPTLDVVEQLIALAGETGISMTHLAMAPRAGDEGNLAFDPS